MRGGLSSLSGEKDEKRRCTGNERGDGAGAAKRKERRLECGEA